MPGAWARARRRFDRAACDRLRGRRLRGTGGHGVCGDCQDVGPLDPAAYSSRGTAPSRHACRTGSTMRQHCSAVSPRTDRRGVLIEDAGEHFSVGGKPPGIEVSTEGDAIDDERIVGSVDVQLERHAIRSHRDPQLGRPGQPGETGQQAGHGFEGQHDLLAPAAERLARAHPEGHTGPSPGVHGERRLGQRLRLPARVHAGFIGVAGQLPALDRARGVPGASRRGRRVVSPDVARPQRVGLAVAQVGGVHAGRRIHRDQREHLQQVALDHVHQSAGAVVVPSPALERQRLVEDDVHGLDVVGAPQRFEEPVGEPQAEQVQHGRLAQEVVDPVDLVLRDEMRQDGVERLRAGRVDPEGLLQHEFGARPAAEPRGALRTPRR